MVGAGLTGYILVGYTVSTGLATGYTFTGYIEAGATTYTLAGTTTTGSIVGSGFVIFVSVYTMYLV